MLIKNSTQRFGVVTRLLHWIIAILILFLIWLGWYMVDLTYFDKWYNGSLAWHKSLGLIVLTLGLAKIGWQTYSPTPRPVTGLKPWERLASGLMHKALLGMIVVIPVTGYLISTSAGKSIDIFGWFSVPALLEVSKTTRDVVIALHFYLAYGAGLLVMGHAGAALKHQFINRDGTLTRIIRG